MQHDTQTKKFPLPMRLLHWLMALVLIPTTIVGIYMAGIPFEAENKFDYYHWHRAFGMLAMALILVRMVIRFKHRQNLPQLPNSLPWYERLAANLVQIVLYVLMLAIPLFGYIATSALPAFPGLPELTSIWFFGFELPLFPVEKDYDITKLTIAIHKYMGYLLIAALVAHIGGALKHKFFDKPEHDVLKTML